MNLNTKLKSDFVDLPNGERFYVHVSGIGEEIIFMIHGMWLDHRCLNPLFPYFDKNFTIIAPDFRGHGKSSYNNPINGVDDFVEDLSYLMDYFEFKKVYFLGWCGGSSVALKYASINPERVEKIVVCSPPGLEGLPLFKRGESGEKLPIQNKLDLINHPSIQRLKNAVFAQDKVTLRRIIETANFNIKKPDPNILDCLAEQCLLVKNVEDVAWSAYTCNLTDHKKWVTEGTGAILKVKNKILLFYGEDDTLIPRHAIDQYITYLGENVTLKLLKDGGHAVHLIYPKEVAEDIISYYNNKEI